MANKNKLQAIDLDEIEKVSISSGRSWKEVLRENLELLAGQRDSGPVFDGDYIARQQASVAEMLKRCRELPVIEHGKRSIYPVW